MKDLILGSLANDSSDPVLLAFLGIAVLPLRTGLFACDLAEFAGYLDIAVEPLQNSLFASSELDVGNFMVVAYFLEVLRVLELFEVQSNSRTAKFLTVRRRTTVEVLMVGAFQLLIVRVMLHILVMDFLTDYMCSMQVLKELLKKYPLS